MPLLGEGEEIDFDGEDIFGGFTLQEPLVQGENFSLGTEGKSSSARTHLRFIHTAHRNHNYSSAIPT